MKISFTQLLPRLKTFIKQLQVLAWLELFEKWTGFFVRLLWIGAFTAFGVYLYKEYHKNIFYLKDFKVPASWVEQGYTGEVVKEAILDEIDKIKLEAYKSYGDQYTRSSRGNENDNTQILSDINVEGFNLKVIVKSILGVLGKKDKSIGGYVTASDSAQIMAVQITDQLTKQFRIGHQKPVEELIHDATLHIMRIKQPLVLFSYYSAKSDTVALHDAYKYLTKHREVINNDDFYIAAMGMGLFVRNYDLADAWADSLLQRYPDDIISYTTKAQVYQFRSYFTASDSLQKVKYNQLYVDYLKKALLHGSERDKRLYLRVINLNLFNHYYGLKQYKVALEYAQKADAAEPLSAQFNNLLAYVYIKQKNYDKAEQLLKKVTNEEPNNGNYWDSVAELYAIQRKDSLAVVNLAKALNAPLKSANVSVQAYQTDPRWQHLQPRKDFRALVYVKK